MTTPRSIIEAVAAVLGVSPADITGRRHSRTSAIARALSWMLMRDLLGFSYPECGAATGHHHSSAQLGCRRMEDRMRRGEHAAPGVSLIEAKRRAMAAIQGDCGGVAALIHNGLRIVMTPAEEGGFIVTSPDDPELITEAGTAAEALAMAQDAMQALLVSRAKLRRSA